MLSMEIQIGDRFTDHDFEWEVVTHPAALTSDPDDMASVYAIESTDGTRGSLVDAFGAYSNRTVSAFLHDVPIRRTVEPGAVVQV